MNGFKNPERPLNAAELDVLATISRDCDPLPSERSIVDMLCLRGLIVYDPATARNVTGYRITGCGRDALKGEPA